MTGPILYSALVVLYLTAFTLGYSYSITILYVQMRGFHYHAYIVSIVQCYLVLGMFLALCVTLPTFGSDATCNYTRKASIFFVPISMRKFRIAGCVVSVFFLSLGTTSIIVHNIFRRESFGVKDYFITNSRTIDRKITILLVLNSITFTLCIAHVETLRIYNHPESGVDESWGFGQVSTQCLHISSE